MRLNLIIDGNFLLSKLVFTLHKNNLLFGSLYTALQNSLNNYKKLYPFSTIFLVSDSKEKSWRKQLLTEYKSHRKKDSEIDWSFVYTTYQNFKKDLVGISILEAPTIEGDDWISFVVSKTNSRGDSNLIISNDHDIKQLITFDLNNLWINFMTNEMYNQEKIFIPNNYQVFIDKISKLPNDDIFNLNDNSEFLNLMKRLLEKYQVNEIDPTKSLMIKVISGDVSDNIQPIFQVVKNGKRRGIGQKGSQKLLECYVNEFGELSLEDPDLFENVADLVCESKKISKSNIPNIVGKIKFNMTLMDLRVKNLPTDVIIKMTRILDENTRL